MSFTGILLVTFAILTLVALGLGLFGMATGGEFNRKYANKLMSMRVTLQAIAIALLALIVFSESP